MGVKVFGLGIGYESPPHVFYIEGRSRDMPSLINAFEDEKPGVPLAEHFNEIATKLKELEAERLREIQPAETPKES